MLRFKQFIKEYYLIESLDQGERDHVDSLGLSTENGAKNFKGIVPEGQTHVEVPIESPMDLKIKDHLQNTPVTNRSGEHLGFYTRDPSNHKLAIHPDGRKVKLSGALKGNPELLKQYAEIGSRGTKPSPESEFENKNNTRWTNDTPSHNRRAFISYHPHAVFGKSHGKDIPWTSCNKWGSGHASDHLDDDVREGGGVAWMTHHDETNPDNPTRAVGRIALNPYHAIGPDGKFLKNEDGSYKHTIIRPSSKGYGEEDSNERFRNTIRQHLEEKHPMIYPRYKLNPHVYQNDESNPIIEKKLTPEEREAHISAAANKNTSDSELGNIAATTRDSLVYKAIAEHKNASDDTLRAVARSSNDPEVHKAIVEHPNAGDITLSNVAFNSSDPEVHKAIAEHKNVSDDTLRAVARSSNDPEVHKAIVAHKNAGDNALSAVASRSDDPEVHKAIELRRKTL